VAGLRTTPIHAREPCREVRLRLSYLYGGVAQYRAGETLPPRILTDYELVLLIEGNATYRVNGERCDLAPGAVVLARPGACEEYLWDARQRTRHAYAHFGLDAIPADWPPPNQWPVHRAGTDSAVPALFRHLLDRARTHDDWPSRQPSAADNRIVEALIELYLRPCSDPAPLECVRPEPVQRALKWMREVIDQDPGRAVHLCDLAAAANVTGKYLCRAFRNTLGRPPMVTYRLLRLQLAVPLLARSHLSVKEIAERCGFEDALYFSRCFSAAFGASPRCVRQNMREGAPPPRNPLPSDVTPRLYW
jgi:AraC-like DNA-binding protein